MFEEKIVSFVDILGFADEVRKAKSNEELENLKNKVKQLREHFGINRIEKENGVDVLTLSFSDCIIRARGFSYAPLFSEILSYVHAIGEIMWNGHLVRGGITHGSFFYDDDENTLISPAFIRAYQLESKAANSPRVIVDPATLKEFQKRKDWYKDTHDYETEAEYVYGMLRLDKDGYYFVDYLKAMMTELDHPPQQYPQFLRRHKMVIEKGYQATNDESIKSKYVWLAQYHNQVISEHVDGDPGSEWEGWNKGLMLDEKFLKL